LATGSPVKEKNRMPFMTIWERMARMEELLAGIELCLDLKFGEKGLQLLPEIRQFTSVEALREVLQAIRTAATPEEVARPWWDPKRCPRTGSRPPARGRGGSDAATTR
jgi:hypothetical protein